MPRRRRTISTTPAAAIGARGQAPRASRRPRRTSTVRSGGGPKRTLTYHGTPVSREGIAPSKAPSAAKRVKKALARIEKAMKSPGGVEGPGISKGEAKFYETLAKKTGLSPRVLAAQGTQEGGADDDFNILNIGHTDSGSLGLTEDPRFSNPKSAAKLTAKFFKGKEFGASPGIQSILRSAGKSEGEQVKAIAGSGWATDPNYFAGISRALPGIKEKPKAKPSKKDKMTLRRAGARPTGGAEAPGSNKKPFKAAGRAGGNPGKLVKPKWDRDDDGHTETVLAKGISPAVKKWARRYGVTIGAAYDPGGGHVSPGHNEAGTATDVYPEDNAWDDPKKLAKFEKGLKVLTGAGFEVGYGTDGIGQAWSNHGRGNHAHIEWLGQGTSAEALKKLAGYSEAKIRKLERSVGTGGGAAPSGGGSSGSSSGFSGGGGSSGGGKSKSDGLAERLARAQAAYSETEGPGSVSPTSRSSSSTLSALKRRYGRRVV